MASVTYVRDERGPRKEAYAGLTVLFGRASASVAQVHDSRGNRVTMDAQQPLPVGVGYGYQFRREGGTNSNVNGVAQYQGAHGRYELRQETIGGESATTLSTMGAIVGIGGNVFATRSGRRQLRAGPCAGCRGRPHIRKPSGDRQDRASRRPAGSGSQPYYGNVLNNR
jgi:hypothetical protein